MTGRTSRLAAGPLVLLAALVPVAVFEPQPAQAQLSNFIDNLLGRKEEEPQKASPSDTQGTAASAKKPTAQKPAKDKAASAEKPADKTGSIKPAAKAALAPPSTATQTGGKVAAIGAPTAGGSLEDADPSVIVERANAYFNSFQTLSGGFMQIGADGRKIGGKLYLAKPGRLRFAYDEPSPLEVVADGTSVAVRDRKLNTQDLYFINQTPLKFLIRDKIDLARDLSVTDVTNEPGGIRVAMEDRSTLGGTSRIQLYFDAEMKTLSQWRITDPQGYLTTVQLSGLQKGKAVDAGLFFIDYGRAEDKAMREQLKRGEAQAQ